MRANAFRVETKRKPLLDTCGTGGDNSSTFNISTAVAFVLAGAGITVAKHGNRSVSSRCGSADVLEALRVNIDLEPSAIGECIDETGIGFLFAQRLHPAMKHAAQVRRELGIRTIFNILGPLANPAGASLQLLGTYSPNLTNTLANVLKALGTTRAMVVHGHSGLDELSISGTNQITQLRDGMVSSFQLSPQDAGLAPAPLDETKGGTPEENAQIIMDVLKGNHGPKRDVVLLNSAAGMIVSGKATSFAEGIKMASVSIDSGSALSKLNQLVSFSQQTAVNRR
jgi:anthranilate phosphoribosyltransferase